jgi:two-component system response regulator YesN
MRFGHEDFKDALNKIRLERAEPLLRKSTLTVSEIASLCGFKSATHFIRVFRKFNGCSPGRFRRSE